MPSHLFGLEQIIEIGPLSGRSNVIFWLEKRGIPATDELVDRIFDAAKQSERILTEEEILALCSAPSAARSNLARKFVESTRRNPRRTCCCIAA